MTTASADHIERIYEALARGIDQAGSENESLFLAKLVLMLANDLGDASHFEERMAACLQRLPPNAGADRPGR